MDERRQYFRIDDMAFVRAARLNSNQTSIAEYFPEVRALTLKGELDRLEQKSFELQSKLDDEVASQLINILNQKVDLLTRFLTIQDLGSARLAPQRITVSEGGVAFVHEQHFEENSLIALAIVFTPSYLPIYCPAEVVQCIQTTEGKWQIHCEFQQIPEAMRQQLARHLLQQQTQQRNG